jgi:hypothetical protein
MELTFQCVKHYLYKKISYHFHKITRNFFSNRKHNIRCCDRLAILSVKYALGFRGSSKIVLTFGFTIKAELTSAQLFELKYNHL